MTELKAPLDEGILDGLMLASDTARVSYQEQLLALEAERKSHHDRKPVEFAHAQSNAKNKVS